MFMYFRFCYRRHYTTCAETAATGPNLRILSEIVAAVMTAPALTTTGYVEAREWRWVFSGSMLLVLIITLPFVWVSDAGAPEWMFMGALANPVDGMSYLAKMTQGWSGSWLFHLPYTPEPHGGAPIYTFYLTLGHVSRILNLPIVIVFHATRLIGSIVMFLTFYRFVADWADSVSQRRITWVIGILGTGFGWLALLAVGEPTPDLLALPEAFPLQAAYANAHFPWGIASGLTIGHILTTQALTDIPQFPGFDIKTVGLAAAAFLLTSIAPFMLPPLAIGYGALIAAIWRKEGHLPRHAFAWGGIVVLFSLPPALNTLLAVAPAHPVFRAWMEQNLTPSPPVWQYLVAFGPLLLLAGVGLWATRPLSDPGEFFLIGWIVGVVVLIYAPVRLQRRFTMGVTAPLAVYAGRGLWRALVPGVKPRLRPAVIGMAALMLLPTTFIAITVPILASVDALAHNGGPYFMAQEERQVISQLQRREPDALVLASPDLSLFLPQYNLRVVYGHSYETLNAEARRRAVLDFFHGTSCNVIREEGVDYVVIGPRERGLSETSPCPVEGERVLASDSGEVVVYAVAGDE